MKFKENTDANDEITSIDPSDVEWSFVERIEDDDLINILLVGQDRRKGESRQRSDAIILCSINPVRLEKLRLYHSYEIYMCKFLADTRTIG